LGFYFRLLVVIFSVVLHLSLPPVAAFVHPVFVLFLARYRFVFLVFRQNTRSARTARPLADIRFPREAKEAKRFEVQARTTMLSAPVA